MRLDYKFSNLCGTVHTQGNLLYTPDGKSLLSAVGNRVSVFDLVNNQSCTLPIELHKNVEIMCLSPNGVLLLIIDEDGRAMLINLVRKLIIHYHSFKERVYAAKYSPNGKLFAVGLEKTVQVWKTPGYQREFTPFVLHNTYSGHYKPVTNLDWSSDGRFLLTTSHDLTCRIFHIKGKKNYKPFTLSGHRDVVQGAWFTGDDTQIFSCSRDGAVFRWKFQPANPHNPDQPARWRLHEKHFFNQNNAQVSTAAFHKPSSLLVVGFTTGIFGLWELPDFTSVHTLSIGSHEVSTCAINATGEWLAFGSKKLGQLLVWEWQAELYVIKQQGHFQPLTTVSYSKNGEHIATGSGDGKVKIWSTQTGFCFVTFKEHRSGITAVEFAKQGQVVFSASLDGTVRAYDLIRYRNFRTFTSPQPTSFTAMAVDVTGELVLASGIDKFELYVWSVQTGKLLDILSGHEGPISHLQFAPTATTSDTASAGSEGQSGLVASSSWDKSVRLWDLFGRNGGHTIDTLVHGSSVLTCVFSPDSKQVACATLDGQIVLWSVSDAKQLGTIEGRKDISGGRHQSDRMTAENNTNSQHFTTLCYNNDGSCIIAGGNSKYVCLYHVESRVLLKKFQTSSNLSLDGILEKLNSKFMTEAGPLALIDTSGEITDLNERLAVQNALPGVESGDLSKRQQTMPKIRTTAVQFSPTNRAFAVASTEGLLIYSLDDFVVFDPTDLELDLTVDSCVETLNNGQYLEALVMSIKLDQHALVQRCFHAVPEREVDLVVKNFPLKLLPKLMELLAYSLEQSPRVQYVMCWIFLVLKYHNRYILSQKTLLGNALTHLQKSISTNWSSLADMCDENRYRMEYLLRR